MGIFYLDQSWTLRGDDNQLICSAGADQLFAIDEVDVSVLKLLLNSGKKGKFNTSIMPERAIEIIEQLLSAGIVHPKLTAKSKRYKMAVIGTQNKTQFKAITDSLSATITTPEKADLLIIFRTNQTFAEMLEMLDYPSLVVPHLLIDTAYHHTLSFGPLVFPGQTACLACLQGRLANRWGDDQPPPQPAINNNIDLVLQLLKLELAKIINNEDYSLVQKTIVYDFESRTIDINSLYKVPLCPICTKNKLDISGKIALPWA